MNKKTLLALTLGGIVIVAASNINFFPEAAASEYLDGYDYPEDPVPAPAPDLTVEVCQPLHELQAREAYFTRLWEFAHEISVDHVIETQRLDYIKAEQELKTNVDVY